MADLLNSTDPPFTAEDLLFNGVRVRDSDNAYDIIYLLFHYNRQGEVVVLKVGFYNGKITRPTEGFQEHLDAIRRATAGDASAPKSNHYRVAAQRERSSMVPVCRPEKGYKHLYLAEQIVTSLFSTFCKASLKLLSDLSRGEEITVANA